MRQDIIEALESSGPCTIRELARLVGKRPDALYYHVRVLRRFGLLVEVAPRREGGREDACVDVLRKPLNIHYAPESRSNRNAVLALAATITRNANRRFARAFDSGIAVVGGEERNLWAARKQGWLAADDLRRLNRLLREVLVLFEGCREPSADGRTRQELSFILAPLPDRRVPRRTKRRRQGRTP